MLAVLGDRTPNSLCRQTSLRDDLVTGDKLTTTEEVEVLIRSAEPKVKMIFLETALQSESSEPEPVPGHIG